MEEKIDRCVICGKQLTKSESITRSMGDVCAAKMGLFVRPVRPYSHKRLPSTPEYTYHIVEMCGNVVAIAIYSGNASTVPNAAEYICDELKVSYLIYRDPVGSWGLFDTEKGHLILDLHDSPTLSMDTAIEVTRIRYFNDLGGLFSGGE